jgi:Cof subfamily protein (haloacid dehalogenase superfamily)
MTFANGHHKVRLIALDIDGTLLDSAAEVPTANRHAIEAAAANGIEIALVTGRRFDFALPIAQQIPCDLTMIVNNGAVVKSKDGKTHLKRLLPHQTARAILGLLPEHRAGAAIVFDRVRENQVIYEKIDWEDPRRKAYFARNREFLANVCPLEDCLVEDPIQLMYSGSVTEMRQVASLLRGAPQALEFSLAVTFYDHRDFGMVDVIRLNCSKGSALAEWTALRGFGREEVMAIGDNFNDREMLEFAGLPIVMANSVPELKMFGWRQTLSNDEGGVAAAIRQYALENT